MDFFARKQKGQLIYQSRHYFHFDKNLLQPILLISETGGFSSPTVQCSCAVVNGAITLSLMTLCTAA
jgi:hypothetical protein